MEKYDILTINIFEEQVFDDTTQTVCSFQFALQNTENYTPETQCYVYPEKKKIKFILNKNNNYTIGGEIYNLYQNKNFKITRATSKNYQSKFRTNLVLKCLDDVNTKINLSYIEKSQPYVDITPKSSGRAFATLLIEPQLTMEEQKVLAERFNTFLAYVNLICAPDHIIVGGGTSKDWDKFSKYLEVDCPVMPAEFLNQAGIIGAAVSVTHPHA